jgi:regulation of enolase protein 1 (concanavalin A-like superfamily)
MMNGRESSIATENATVTDLFLPGLPFPLTPSGTPACQAEVNAGALTVTAGPKSDMFIDPAGDEGARPDAGRLTGLPGDQDFTLAARVTVGFQNVFDAGVLVLYLSERRWAKLCYEFSPQREPTAVSVVTHGTSDDCNSFTTGGEPLWLRVTRSGRAWAFHASRDGAWWQLLRYFTLGEASGARVGFLAQSPSGPACTAVFDSISYHSGAPADLRDGS